MDTALWLLVVIAALGLGLVVGLVVGGAVAEATMLPLIRRMADRLRWLRAEVDRLTPAPPVDVVDDELARHIINDLDR